MSLIDDIKFRYSQLGNIGKLISVNVAVFVILSLITFLFKSELLTRILYLPKAFGDFIVQPWSIITYSFLHAGFWHLAFNMLMLYFVGRLFLNFHSVRTFFNVYFLGAICGGLLFLISYNLFPAFIALNPPLVGASAAVMATLIFVTTDRANMEIPIFGYTVQLWKIGAFFVILDLIRIPTHQENAGGYIAHLGGAFLGYIYAKQLAKGNDIGSGFGKMMDTIVSYFKPRQKTKLKTVYKSNAKKRTPSKKTVNTSDDQRQIDAILDKISKSGYESLTQQEKDFLFQAGKK